MPFMIEIGSYEVAIIILRKSSVKEQDFQAGVRGRLLQLIKIYLSGREQRIYVRGPFSEWIEETSGELQGSVLGLPFFLIYVNDFSDGLHSYLNIFPDDSRIMGEVRNDLDGISLKRTKGIWTSSRDDLIHSYVHSDQMQGIETGTQ